MFKCFVTEKCSKVGEKCTKVIVETRARTYRHWDEEKEEEWFTYGSEIVKEVPMTREGMAIWNGWSLDQRSLFLEAKKKAA